MPIYEFYCPDNHTIYSFLARSLAMRDQTPLCPDGAELRMEKRVSAFAFIGRAKEDPAGDPFAGLDEDKMDTFMADMECDMGALDANNPDPKQLGHFMRKMTDAMGSNAPPELREMVRRLEAGEDPEKLEAEFGNADESAAGDALLNQFLQRARPSRRAPARDPKLYEFRDYLRPDDAGGVTKP